ncbi:hypothetical protein BDR05DRAFT_970747 [Suillus weaverae]|nr:hypothetical protein BDR05DRAFT_970747 [Suillus weaverae]
MVSSIHTLTVPCALCSPYLWYSTLVLIEWSSPLILSTIGLGISIDFSNSENNIEPAEVRIGELLRLIERDAGKTLRQTFSPPIERLEKPRRTYHLYCYCSGKLSLGNTFYLHSRYKRLVMKTFIPTCMGLQRVPAVVRYAIQDKVSYCTIIRQADPPPETTFPDWNILGSVLAKSQTSN